MAKCKSVVELFYDVVSPYSYITFEALIRYNKKFTSMDLKLKPFYLSAVMGATNNSPPGLVPARAQYMGKDLYRLSKYYDIPFKWPKDIGNVMFQKGTLSTQRLLTSIEKHCPENLEAVSRELFLRVWYKDEDVSTSNSLKEACNTIGISQDKIETIVNDITNSEIKQKLRDTTQKALDFGAFGAPTYVGHFSNDPRMFFGSDRLFMLAHYLNEQYPGPLKELKA
ncbi:unnamed protein product [Clavelina lepadiformis]|uniref:Glutathione S-transferase kappa n=1 Tax=Clavelina lepadiformis TaxID=159417 RepID=A0ABP0GXA7_CLALP